MNMRKAQIGGRACYIYEYGEPEAILIQPVDDYDIAVLDSEAEHISGLAGGKGFILAAFKIDDWNRELSPWPAPAVFGDEVFGDGAAETLNYITETLLPEIRQRLEMPETPETQDDPEPHQNQETQNAPEAHQNQETQYDPETQHKPGIHEISVFIGGYSLAGLFSLWASYQTERFSGVAAASPSVWFPGWIEYAGSNVILADKVYLSLGDKEERTRNPVMRMVGDNIRKQLEILSGASGCSQSILEMNPGNHFKEPDLRTAKAFAWLLTH